MTDNREFTALDQRLDEQQQLLQTRIATLEKQIRASEGERTGELQDQLRELQLLQQRLIKSRGLVRRAHDLRQGESIEIREAPYRNLGLALIIFSVIAGIALGIYAFKTL